MQKGSKAISIQGSVCPRPISQREEIVLGHGSGGKLSRDLIEGSFYPAFKNPFLLQGDDAALIGEFRGRLAICTDGHIVSPLFFPGGDIGRLAICGTVNDLAMIGAQPQWLTASFVIEEGFKVADLERVIAAMNVAAEEAGVLIVAGDTKVAERGKADGVFIHTSGVGVVPPERQVSGSNARPGDVVLLSGYLGDHGMAVLTARGDLALQNEIESDVAPLNGMVERMFAAHTGIHAMRDPTRGGVATALNEISRQSDVAVFLDEVAIPVRPAVRAACELLGFDPLYVANEGKLLAIVAPEAEEAVLEAMRSSKYGQDACRIGEVQAAPAGRVMLHTAIGATRMVNVLSGEMLPRIC